MKKLQYFDSLESARRVLREEGFARPFDPARARALLHRPPGFRRHRQRGLFRFHSFEEAQAHALQQMIQDSVGDA